MAELRRRVIFSLAVWASASIAAGIWLYQPALHLLLIPYCEVPARFRAATASGPHCALLVTGPLDAFNIRMELSLFLGLLISLPVLAVQLWRFITPGLTAAERRWTLPFALVTTALFLSGVTMAAVTLPKGIHFLAAVGGQGLVSFYTADAYVHFVALVGLAFGLTFEFPLVLISLVAVGLLSSTQLLRSWRGAVVGLTIVAAIVTPSQDPFSLFALAIPLWIFYFAAAVIARAVIEPARLRRAVALHSVPQGGSGTR